MPPTVVAILRFIVEIIKWLNSHHFERNTQKNDPLTNQQQTYIGPPSLPLGTTVIVPPLPLLLSFLGVVPSNVDCGDALGLERIH